VKIAHLMFGVALLHLALGIYLRIHREIWLKTGQIFASVLLFAASLLLVWAFIEETYFTRSFSELSRWGIYLSLASDLAPD
jgi:hypothetical protein